jgi:hypothetical protein
LPAARPTSHLPNFVWWLALGLLVFAGFFSQRVYVRLHHHAPPPPPGREREAFLALSFGKIGDFGEDFMPAAAFAEGLKALHDAGYSTVSLAQVDGFFRQGKPLPDRPLLLLFEEAQRDSTEIADAALASLGFRAVAFTDVRQLQATNTDLISIHRLEQLVSTGRWEFGIAGCRGADEGAEAFSTEELRHDRAALENWMGQPALAVDCRRALVDPDAASAWKTALSQASVPLGFVLLNPRADYRDDLPFALRSIHVAKDWQAQDFVARVEAHAPRRETFRDDFAASTPSPAWLVDRADLTQKNGTLQIAARSGDNGALISLGGTERWGDADVEVEVAEVVRGQFWLTLRSQLGAYLRLGLVDGQAVAQESDGKETHQLGRRAAPARHVKLGLRVIGSRAIATVDGVPLLDRPAEIPAGLERGPLALAVWEPDGDGAVRLARIEAKPLRRHYGIVGARPSAEAWEELRHRVDELAALSPRYFAWRGDRGVETGERDEAMVIFAGLHRLKLLPAVQLELDPSAARDTKALESQLVRWASSPGFGGLNLIIDGRIAADPRWSAFFAGLREKLARSHEELALTVVGGSPQDDDALLHAPADDVSALQIAVGRTLSIDSGGAAS